MQLQHVIYLHFCTNFILSIFVTNALAIFTKTAMQNNILELHH